SNTLLEEELGDMIRIYSWLDKLSPQNYYQARRAYAEARVAFERKNFEDAQMNLDQAIKLDPNWAMPYNLIGRIYSNRREYVRAKMFYQKAIEVEGNWIAPHMNLCVSSIENLKNYSLGEEACRPVIKLDPDRAAGHYFLGRALEGQHRYCEALSEYRIALLKVENTSSPSFNVDRLSKAIEIMASRTFCGNK
ncbi:MAG: tetratricopeptide repeat protein, partial [Blastocatellia bacterium]